MIDLELPKFRQVFIMGVAGYMLYELYNMAKESAKNRRKEVQKLSEMDEEDRRIPDEERIRNRKIADTICGSFSSTENYGAEEYVKALEIPVKDVKLAVQIKYNIRMKHGFFSLNEDIITYQTKRSILFKLDVPFQCKLNHGITGEGKATFQNNILKIRFIELNTEREFKRVIKFDFTKMKVVRYISGRHAPRAKMVTRVEKNTEVEQSGDSSEKQATNKQQPDREEQLLVTDPEKYFRIDAKKNTC